jgi:tRNA 2-thiouridine synthesizing protein A
MSRHELDTRGLLCPLPVIRTQTKVAALQPGDILEVHATDPGALVDIPAWCRVHGHEVVSSAREKNDVRVVLKVGAT